MGSGALERAPTVELEDAIVQLHGLMGAAHRKLLAFVAEFDRRNAWRRDGAASMEQWLCARLSVSFGTASMWVEAAAKLEALPATAGVYEQGGVSWDQMRSVMRFATPDRDDEIARDAPGWSAAQTEAVARRELAASRSEAELALDQRTFRARWDLAQSLFKFWGRLPAAEGAVLEKALERAAREAPADRDAPFDARLADALVEICSARLAGDADADRATVVVHVDERVHGGSLPNGARVAFETARRLACDARVQEIVETAGGEPLGIGRASRQVPGWLLRSLRERDGGCRFPGCGRMRWLHAHHVVHWADGGPTDADNLVLLCGYHHRLVHERGWRVEPGSFEFVRPDGRSYAPRPQPLRSEIRERFMPLLA
jgi:hypothetical protein